MLVFLEYFQLTPCLYFYLKFYLYANQLRGLYTYTHLVNVGSVCFVVFLV